MPNAGSVTIWIQELRQGDQEHLQQLWHVYFDRVIGLARSQLTGAACVVSDEEDVAQSVLQSVCQGVEEGRFSRLGDREDLWQILVMVTCRKARNLIKHERRQKRDSGRGRHLSALAEANGRDATDFLELISSEPGPEMAVQLAEDLRLLLDQLPEPLRAIACWKMEGCTHSEIAQKIGRSIKTVERKVQLIRQMWEKEMA